jgi:hypothetical protein
MADEAAIDPDALGRLRAARLPASAPYNVGFTTKEESWNRNT